MDLSVVLCTHNRCESLARALRSIVAQDGLDGVTWEVAVVDNGSTDATAAVVEGAAARSSVALRYLREPEIGLCRARNRGVAATGAPYIAFTDDDIVAEPRWLANLYGTIREERCAVAGGRIRVRSPREMPPWVDRTLLGCLGELDLGARRVPMDGVESYPFGANMIFERRALQSAGLFDESLGRRGEGRRWWQLVKGEEQEIVGRILRDGGRSIYAPDAILWHCIRAEQVSKGFFRRLYFAAGHQFMVARDPSSGPKVSGFAWECCTATFWWMKSRIQHGADRSLGRELDVMFKLGMLAALCRRRWASAASSVARDPRYPRSLAR